MKKNKKNILITRKLGKQSPMWQLLNEDYNVIDQSFVTIHPLPNIIIPKVDVFFYYSKNAVKHFIESASDLKEELSNSLHAAMGNGTARALTECGMEIDFIGNGTPSEIAAKLQQKYSKQSICFVRAKQSTCSIQKQWPKDYEEVVSYSLTPSPFKITEEINTIFATSPMNLTTAIECCNTTSLKNIICIGPTTFKAAQQYKDVNIKIAKCSSEQSLLEAFIQMQTA